MQILLGILIGAVVGLVVHFALPGRNGRGMVVAPIVGAAVAAVVWAGLTWLGFGIDAPWIWLAAIVIPAVVTVPVVLALAAARRRTEAAERARLHLV